MTNRYKTEKEIEGTKRRMAAYRSRMQESGMSQKTFWVTKDEGARLKQLIDYWHEAAVELTLEQQAAANVLKPKKGD